MDLAKAFTFVTEDERWVSKLGIAVLMSMLTIFILPLPLLVGYMVGVARNVQAGRPRPLPEWEEFGVLFRDGLAIIAASVVYTLPFWLLACIAFFATAGLGRLGEVSQDAVAVGVLATYGLIGCLTLVFVLALFVISPAIVIQYVRTGQLGATLQVGRVLAFTRDHLGDILIAALAPFVATIALSTIIGLFSVIPVIGWCGGPLISLVVYPYITLATGHIYGQIAGKTGDSDKGDLTAA